MADNVHSVITDKKALETKMQKSSTQHEFISKDNNLSVLQKNWSGHGLQMGCQRLVRLVWGARWNCSTVPSSGFTYNKKNTFIRNVDSRMCQK